jgi:hypothetical protein
MNRSSLTLLGVSISSMLIGAGTGYIVAEKKLAARFDKRLAEETEEMREFYTIHEKKYPTPQDAAADLIGATLLTVEEKETQRVEYHKIAKKYDSEDDPEEELAIEAEVGPVLASNVFDEKTDRDRPYIVSQEDFMQNNLGYEQGQLTYYEKDKVLTDERETVIEDVDATVGENNIQFGIGSSDVNVVHIRNEKLRMDFELVRSEGSYAQEVLGLDEVPEQKPRLSARQRRDM